MLVDPMTSSRPTASTETGAVAIDWLRRSIDEATATIDRDWPLANAAPEPRLR